MEKLHASEKRTPSRTAGSQKRKTSFSNLLCITLLVTASILTVTALYLSILLALSHQKGKALLSPAQLAASGSTVSGSKRNITLTTSTVAVRKPGIIEQNNAVYKSKTAAVATNSTFVKHDSSASHGEIENQIGDDKYAKDRVYCMVPFIWNEDFYKVIMETWGKRCDVINFLTDSIVGGGVRGDNVDPLAGYKPYTEYPPGTFPENVIFVNMTRPWTGCLNNKNNQTKVCRHIWEKMWRSWVYVEEHHADQAEWFCKVDYDTFFFPENLKYYVRDFKNWDPYNEHHYFGHMLQHKNNRPPMIAGAAVCWSVKTLHAIADVYRNMPKGHLGGERGKCEDRALASEEITTSICLKTELGVDPEPARDEKMREQVTLERFEEVLLWNRTEQGEWWYWMKKPTEVGQMEDCCALRPIGVHGYKELWRITNLEQYFYSSSDNNELTKLEGRNKRYVMKVRKAMGND